MSNNCKRNPVKVEVAAKGLPPRNSRHGRALLGPEGPYTKTWRTVEENKKTGELEVKIHERPMTLEEVQQERVKLRATKSTNNYGTKRPSA